MFFKDADAILHLLLVLALDILGLHGRLGRGGRRGLRPLRHDYLIKYAYFDEMLFRTFASINDLQNWTTNVA